MSPFSSDEFAYRTIRSVQIIVVALALGPIVFAGMILFQRMNKGPQRDAMIAYLAAGFAVTALAARGVVGAATTTAQRKRIAARAWSPGPNAAPVNLTDGDRFLFVFQQKTIIEAALVEGATFFVLISFMIAGQWWSLAVAGVLLLFLIVPFPTYDRVESWVRYQLELMEMERR